MKCRVQFAFSKYTMRLWKQRLFRKISVFLLFVVLMFTYLFYQDVQSTNVYDIQFHNTQKIQKRHFKTQKLKSRATSPSLLENRNDIQVQVHHFQHNKWKIYQNFCETFSSYPLSSLTGPPKTQLYVYTPEEDKWISGNIITKGEWKGNWTSQVVRLLEDDEDLVFIDVGANLGMFTLIAAKAGHSVIAIDCMRSALSRLCSSIKLEKLQNHVKVVYNAVSDIHGNARLETFDGNKGATRITSIDKHGEEEETDDDVVSIVLLDDLIDYFNISKVVMKICVEGHEVKVLQGAEKFFKSVYVKYLVTEFAKHRRWQSAYKIFDFLKKQNMEPVLPDIHLHAKTFARWPSMILWKHV